MCESRGGRPGLPSLIRPATVSVDVKQHFNNNNPTTDTRRLSVEELSPFQAVMRLRSLITTADVTT